MTYLYLLGAIICEVVATSALKASEEFSKPGPSLLVVAGYGLSFWFLMIVIRTMPIGIAYAVWAGLGIVLVTLAGAVIYRQIPDLAAVAGIALIVCGVVVIHLFSNSVPR